jgi:hypothetical protein
MWLDHHGPLSTPDRTEYPPFGFRSWCCVYCDENTIDTVGSLMPLMDWTNCHEIIQSTIVRGQMRSPHSRPQSRLQPAELHEIMIQRGFESTSIIAEPPGKHVGSRRSRGHRKYRAFTVTCSPLQSGPVPAPDCSGPHRSAPGSCPLQRLSQPQSCSYRTMVTGHYR